MICAEDLTLQKQKLKNADEPVVKTVGDILSQQKFIEHTIESLMPMMDKEFQRCVHCCDSYSEGL